MSSKGQGGNEKLHVVTLWTETKDPKIIVKPR